MTASLAPQLLSVQEIFTNSLFEIPGYQRAYAWETKQCDDLWDDITEGLETNTDHFLGTLVFMKQDEGRSDEQGRPLAVFDVVDGQQRLTTLCLLLLAISAEIRKTHLGISQGIWSDFIAVNDQLPRLALGGRGSTYFTTLTSALRCGVALPVPQSSPERRIHGALEGLRRHVREWVGRSSARDISELTSYVRSRLRVLRFVTDSRPLAIKMFQTVNDRGKDLSLLDKTKSFLMFNLTRYLSDDAEALREVERAFTAVYNNYDDVRDLATKYRVEYLTNPRYRFNEDEFLRYTYHYAFRELTQAFDLQFSYEYGITPEQIFQQFVKGACSALQRDPAQLRELIDALCKGLHAVSAALLRLLQRIETDDYCKNLLEFQNPSASVYPLLVATEAQDMLDARLLVAIAILDLRVYKVRGTDPKADLYKDAVSRVKTSARDDIYSMVIRYCHDFGDDQALDNTLHGPVYQQSYTKYVLWNFAVRNDPDVTALDEVLYRDCQLEHILAQKDNTFDATTFGFDNAEDYTRSKDTFGNLMPLEARLNNQIKNKPPKAKTTSYIKSKLAANRQLGTHIQATSCHGGFGKSDQDMRTNDVIAYFKTTWSIPPLPTTCQMSTSTSPPTAGAVVS